MKGQANNWYPPARQREAQRAELKRQANKILAHDRTRRRSWPRQPQEMTSMMFAFLKGLQVWVQAHAECDVIRIPVSDITTCDQLAKVIYRILQTERERISRA
jgi:hypothetical protein